MRKNLTSVCCFQTGKRGWGKRRGREELEDKDKFS
jgi:hypothetical protein